MDSDGQMMDLCHGAVPQGTRIRQGKHGDSKGKRMATPEIYVRLSQGNQTGPKYVSSWCCMLQGMVGSSCLVVLAV